MVKVEMKRLNNLIANRDPLRNTLLKADKHRIYPLNVKGTSTSGLENNEPPHKKFWDI